MTEKSQDLIIFQETQKLIGIAILIRAAIVAGALGALVVILSVSGGAPSVKEVVGLLVFILFCAAITALFASFETIITYVDDEAVSVYRGPYMQTGYMPKTQIRFNDIVSFNIASAPIISPFKGAFWMYGSHGSYNMGRETGVQITHKNAWTRFWYSPTIVIGSNRPKDLIAALEKQTGLQSSSSTNAHY